MHGNSSPVTSSQTEPHSSLVSVVRKHLATPYRRPPVEHSLTALEQIAQAVPADMPVVLDLGCGTGESCAALAARHPDCFVVGVDRSAARLDKTPPTDHAHRIVTVRAHVEDIVLRWNEVLAAPVHKIYLLFPNPSPKPGLLMRRWHAHPVFPAMLALPQKIEMRTNWDIYAREFALAVSLISGVPCAPQQYSASADEALSPFEKKYNLSGHPLWRVRHAAAPPRVS